MCERLNFFPEGFEFLQDAVIFLLILFQNAVLLGNLALLHLFNGLIAKKYASMFFKPFTYQREKVSFSVGEKSFTLSIKNVVDAGYKAIYANDGDKMQDKDETEITGKFVFIEQQEFPIIRAEETERETKPPRYYNEGSIIKAMSSISSEDQELSSKLREVKGIGTPATRATIIEELIKENLIQTQKKNLIPTEAGIQLIALIPEEIKKADYMIIFRP